MERCIELAMSIMVLMVLCASMVGAYFRRNNNKTLESANRNMKQLPLFIPSEYRRGACAQSASSKISALHISATHTRATGGKKPASPVCVAVLGIALNVLARDQVLDAALDDLQRIAVRLHKRSRNSTARMPRDDSYSLVGLEQFHELHVDFLYQVWMPHNFAALH